MNFFNPAIALLLTLKFPQKVTLMGLLLLVPLLLLVSISVEKIYEEIDVADRERIGVEYSIELRKLLEHLPRYRGLVYLGLENESTIESLQAEKQLVVVQNAVRDIDNINWRGTCKIIKLS